MFFRFRRRLLFLVPFMANALPQTSTSLPQSLQNKIPSCSWSCLTTFIQTNFPQSICSNAGDLDCLCSHTGVGGFTLGEGAFVCAHQSCPKETSSTINATYRICSGEADSVTATHTILPTSFTAAPTKSASTQMSTFTPSSTPAAVTTSATPMSSPNHGLQTSQIIGIAVASGVVVLVGIAVAVFLVCLRRRRRRLKLDSEPLPSAEFIKPPQPASSPRGVERQGLGIAAKDPPKGSIDPRGGAGGVGVAPVRYKAIHPPSQLFFPSQYSRRPENVDANAVTQNRENPPQSRTATSQLVSRAQGSPQSVGNERRLSHSAPNEQRAVPSVVISGPRSPDKALPSATAPSEPAKKTRTRPPSVLLPAKPVMARLAQERPYSTASQMTEFEEDRRVMSTMTQFEEDFQSPTIPPAISNMTVFPIPTSSDETTSCSDEATPPSDDDPSRFPSSAGNRKSRGPSLRINIPGKPQNLSGARGMPPPPPRNGAAEPASKRPQLATAGAVGLPYWTESKKKAGPAQRRISYVNPATQPSAALPPPPPRNQSLRPNLIRQPQAQASTSASPPPLQFPVPPTRKLVAHTSPQQTEHARKESVSRRGFSQPKPVTFQHPPQRQQLSPKAISGPLTVNGERINYPTIPRPSASPPIPSPPASFNGPLPPPPPLPAALSTQGTGSSRSSLESYGSSTAGNSLLAKRRGSERAAVLEKQLYIGKSNGSTNGSAPNSGSVPGSLASPRQFRGAGHGRADSMDATSPPMSGSPLRPNAGPRIGPYKPHEEALARRWPGQVQQSNVRLVPPGSGQVRAGGPQQQQQYAAYYPPPPLRPGVRNMEAPILSPMPKTMTPTRRGEDMYLSIS